MQNGPRISDAEWLVMQMIWGRSPITAAEVIEALAPATIWKPKTAMTLLNRLVKKGVLGFEKKGRAYHYYPLVEQDECVKAENHSFLQRVYGGALKPMLADFLEEAELSKEDIEELKQMLDKGGQEK